MATWIISAIIAAGVILIIVRSLVNLKKGKSCCGGGKNCSCCKKS